MIYDFMKFTLTICVVPSISSVRCPGLTHLAYIDYFGQLSLTLNVLETCPRCRTVSSSGRILFSFSPDMKLAGSVIPLKTLGTLDLLFL